MSGCQKNPLDKSVQRVYDMHREMSLDSKSRYTHQGAFV